MKDLNSSDLKIWGPQESQKLKAVKGFDIATGLEVC